MKAAAAALALLITGTVGHAAGEPPLPEVATALERIRDHSTIELTTTGRRSGRDHVKPIWFVVSDGGILVQAGKDGSTDWYRNLVKNPSVLVRQGEYTFRSRAVPITDPVRVRHVHDLFLRKYTSARVLSWFGSSIGQGHPVELLPVSVVVRR